MSLRALKVLFFIVGPVPSGAEQVAIDALKDQAANVQVRSMLSDTTYGGKVELADRIAILVPGANYVNLPAAYVSANAPIYADVTPAAGGSVVLDTGDAVLINSTAGTKQKETATVAGTITVAGTVIATVTCAALAGSPLAISAEVVVGDTAAIVAGKLRDALAANAAIAALFTVSGATTAIILEVLFGAANDGTLNIATTNGTAAGLTPAASSANTTAGVAPTAATGGTAVVAKNALQFILQA